MILLCPVHYPSLYGYAMQIWTCILFINFVCPRWLLGWTCLNNLQRRALTFLVWYLVLKVSSWIVIEHFTV